MVQLYQSCSGTIEGIENREVRTHDYVGLVVKSAQNFLIRIPRTQEQSQSAQKNLSGRIGSVWVQIRLDFYSNKNSQKRTN